MNRLKKLPNIPRTLKIPTYIKETYMENQKQIRITPAAQEKMKQLKVEGQDFKIVMLNHSWSGPEFRLVQTDQLGEDTIPFQQGDVTVYIDKETLPYIDILDVGLFVAYGEEVFLVEENLI